MALTMGGYNMSKITRLISTKMYEGGPAVMTELTINFTGLTDEEIKEVAASAASVKWQSNARRMKFIPAKAEYMVPKPGTRQQTVLTPEGLVARYGSVEAAIAALEALKAKN
jgi:hypothetical protein